MINKIYYKQQSFRFKRFQHKTYSVFNSLNKSITIGVITSLALIMAHQKTIAQKKDIQQVDIEQDVKELELDEVTVTVSHTPISLSQSTKIVKVITANEIKQKPIQSIQDILLYVASIDVIQRGGHGVQADISIRGGTADQTAILLNGVNLSNPHTGHYSLDIPINISDIEKIEILHGPSALIYGSNAFSGGINIITKKNDDIALYANSSVGMHSEFNEEIRFAKSLGKSINSLSAGFQHSNGYIQNSNYNIVNSLWQSRLKLTGDAKIDFQTGINSKSYGANTFYSALYPNQYERTTEIMSSLTGFFGQKFKIVPQIAWTRHYDQFDLIKNTENGRNYHKGDIYDINLMFHFSSLIGETHFGGELRREEILSSKLGKPLAYPRGNYSLFDGRTQTNIVAEHTYSWKNFIMAAGLLGNHNTLQNKNLFFFPSFSLVYNMFSNIKLKTTWNISNRLPSFTDLYYTTETHNANELLQPERSKSIDFNVGYKTYFLEFSLTGFLMYGRNMIDWIREQGDTKWASWNHTEVNKQGIETFLLLNFGYITSLIDNISISYNRINQECDSKGLESRYTLNYLRDKLTFQLNHKIFKQLELNWNFRYQKRMGTFRKYENGVDLGLVPYPDFSILDLRITYNYKRSTFFLDINNLYDTYYFDLGNVPQAGFRLLGGLSYKIYK